MVWWAAAGSKLGVKECKQLVKRLLTLAEKEYSKALCTAHPEGASAGGKDMAPICGALAAVVQRVEVWALDPARGAGGAGGVVLMAIESAETLTSHPKP